MHIRGAPILRGVIDRDQICHACKSASLKRQTPPKQSKTRMDRPFAKLHLDAQIMPVTGITGAKLFSLLLMITADIALVSQTPLAVSTLRINNMF